MVRQCAWCREFNGEVEPYDDPSITHGICLPCSERLIQEANAIRQSNQVGNSVKNSLEFCPNLQYNRVGTPTT